MLGHDRRSLVEVTVLAIFMTRKVVDGKGTRSSPSHFSFNSQNILSSFHTNIAKLTPVLSPRVTNDPVSFLGIISTVCITVTELTPSDNADNVVGLLTVGVIGEDSTLVRDNRFGVNGSSNGATGKEFFLNGRYDIVIGNAVILKRNLTVLGNSGVGEDINLKVIEWLIEKNGMVQAKKKGQTQG